MKWLIRAGLSALTFALGGLAFGQEDPDDIPPPDSFRSLTACIGANTPAPQDPRPRRAVTAARDFQASTVIAPTFVFDGLGATIMACDDIKITPTDDDTLDLAGYISDVRTEYEALPDSDDDDYAEELAAIEAKYSGAIVDAIAADVRAESSRSDAINDFREAGGILYTDQTDDVVTSGSLDAAYKALTLETSLQSTTDGIEIPTITGVTIALDASNKLDSVTVGSVSLATSGTDDVDFTSATIGSLITLRRASEVAVATAREALAANAAEEVNLSRTQLEGINDYLEVYEERVRLLNSAIRTIERNPEHSADDGDDIVRAYNSALDDYRSAHSRASRRDLAAFASANAIRSQVQNAGSVLEALVNITEIDLGNAMERGDEGEELDPYNAAVAAARAALSNYNAATSDEGSPSSALLAAMIAGDDTGQALLDAVSTNYSTAAEAKAAAEEAVASVSGLTGEDGKIADIEAKLAAKREYIETLAGEIGINPMTGEGTANDMGHTRIDLNEARSMANETAIATNAVNIAANAENILTNHMDIMENRGMIESNTAAIGMNSAAIMEHAGMISANASAISANSSTLSMHTQQISGLVDEMEVVKAGVAAGIAMASMPAVQGNGISLGVGSFDGESAFAVGYQYGGERINFQIGVSSSGGETGAGAGISFAIGQ